VGAAPAEAKLVGFGQVGTFVADGYTLDIVVQASSFEDVQGICFLVL